MARIRLKDVAKAAGVSQGTASNVFNRPETVTPARRQAVLQAAAALDYRGPAPTGRALRSGKANLIALVVEPGLRYLFDDPFAQRLLAGIGEVCDAVGAGLAVVPVGSGRRPGWSIETALADGFILFCMEDGSRLIELARRRGLPFVAVDSGAAAGLVSVNVDDRGGAAAAARHLVELGHRRVGIISFELAGDGRVGPVDAGRERQVSYTVARDRLAGYLDVVAAAGASRRNVPVYETLNDRPATVAGVDAMLAAPAPPTAILAMSDTIALYAIERLTARGLVVPRDVSVVGFDDVPDAGRALPALTTVRQPVEDKGRLAARMLLGLAAPHAAILPATLVVRASTAPPSR